MVVIVLLLGIEKITYNDVNVFDIIAYVFGIISLICCSIVWIPQIKKLIKKRKDEGLSLTMFIIQTCGNVITVVFQAILDHQNWSTWLPYVFNFFEQLIIVIILIVLKCINWKRSKIDDMERQEKELGEIGESLLEDGLYY
jgi:uncharacterized protein with PQ loop repeat